MRKTFLSLLLCAATLTSLAQAQKESTAERAERIFGFVLQNQADSLYKYLTRQMRVVIGKEQMEGILKKAEEKAGKYKSHGQWEVQEMSGSKSCTTTAQFEKEELGALVVFDPSGFILGVQFVPVQAIKKE